MDLTGQSSADARNAGQIAAEDALPSLLEYDSCPICLAPFTRADAVYQTDCLHCYDSECITRYLTGASDCPLCRATIKTVKLRKPAGVALSQAFPLPTVASSAAPAPLPSTGTVASASSSSVPSSSSSSSHAASALRSASSPAPATPFERRHLKDLVVVRAKYNKQTYDVPLRCDCSFKDFRKQIGTLLSLDPSHVKLIHKGKLLSSESKELLREVLTTDPTPTFQIVASQKLEQGKWAQDEEKSKCAVQ